MFTAGVMFVTAGTRQLRGNFSLYSSHWSAKYGAFESRGPHGRLMAEKDHPFWLLYEKHTILGNIESNVLAVRTNIVLINTCVTVILALILSIKLLNQLYRWIHTLNLLGF